MTSPWHALAALEVHVAAVELSAAAALAGAGLPADLARAPRPEEVASRTNYAGIDTAVTSATREVLAYADAARSAVLASIGELLATADDPAAALAILDRLAAGILVLPGAERTVDFYATRIRAVLHSLAVTAAAQVQADAQAAGITMGHAGLTPATVARIESQSLRVAAEAADAALRAARGAGYAIGRTGVPVADFLAGVLSTAGSATTRALPDVAAQAALKAHGAGRMDGLAGVVSPVRYYASELLDRHTCAPCDTVDGKAYPDRAAMLVDYPDGQYVGCLGGSRCRGTAVAVSETERTATLPAPYALAAAPVRPPDLPTPPTRV